MCKRAYHDSALAEVNSLVRKYNALAPYAVLRAYYVREVELARIYHESGEEILRELEGRLRDSGGAKAKGEARQVLVGMMKKTCSWGRLLLGTCKGGHRRDRHPSSAHVILFFFPNRTTPPPHPRCRNPIPPPP
jgi:hypothetical protein